MTGHEPCTPHRAAGDDSEPRSELADLVHAMLGRRIRDLRVEFDGRGLVLRGRTESYHAKQLAQHVALAAVGLPLSANEIVVTYLRGERPRSDGDAALAFGPTPHATESEPHTPRAAATLDHDDTAPGDARVAG